jgi:hypothetical protein
MEMADARRSSNDEPAEVKSGTEASTSDGCGQSFLTASITSAYVTYYKVCLLFV